MIMLRTILAVSVLFVGAAHVLGAGNSDHIKTPTQPTIYRTAADIVRQEAADLAAAATVVDFTWSADVYGNVFAIRDVEIRNAASFAIKDIAIRCEVYGKSGTQIGTVTATIYDSIQPGKARTFRNFDMGFINPQAARASCEVITSSRA